MNQIGTSENKVQAGRGQADQTVTSEKQVQSGRGQANQHLSDRKGPARASAGSRALHISEVLKLVTDQEKGLEPAGARSGSDWVWLLFGRLPPS